MKISPFKPPINFAKVDDILYRSSQPNEFELSYLKNNYEITDIFNLSDNPPFRVTDKEKSLASFLGINYKTIPSKIDNPVWENIKFFVDSVNALKQKSNAKALVHCNAGVDRTGTYVLFYQLINKLKTFNEAVKDMIKMGHNPKFHPNLLPKIKEIAISHKII